LVSYQFQGVLSRLAKEAMHVAVSMTNGCDF
jgi:AhpD family alkylhydroperoxidase